MKFFDVHDRSDFEMFTQAQADTWKKMLTPRFGISKDKRLRMRWFLWAFYFGKPIKKGKKKNG